MHRPTVGILALILLVVGAIALVFPGDEGSRQNVAAGCLRVGLILAVVWLALPELTRSTSRWFLLGTIAVAIVLARWPRLIVVVAVFLVAIAILRPRVKAYVGRGR